MADFVNVLSVISLLSGNNKQNITEPPECVPKIPTSIFHYYLLIPSVLTTLLLASTMSRTNKWLTHFGGRPGAVYPMNIIGKSHRFPYAAAWGSIAFLATDLVLGETSIVHLSGPSYVTVFNTILSMIIIGVDYFPLFAALALESVIGYMIGTSYAWMLLIVQIYKEAECDLDAQARLILFFRDMPNIICLVYLSLSLPVRAIRSVRNKSVRIISSSERVSILKLTKKVTFSSEAKHVKNLLKPVPPLPEPSAGTCKDKLTEMLKNFIYNWIYQSKPGFRYSARMLSVMVIGLMLIYKVTMELTVAFVLLFETTQSIAQSSLDELGWTPKVNETQSTTSTRDVTLLLYHMIIDAKICFIVAISLACAGGVLGILHMLSSYRANLLDLYKGENTHIPPRSTLPNASILVGSIKYAGYQVAYIAWGFILHLVVLFLIALAICILVALIRAGFYHWILTLLSSSWPALLLTISVMLTQKMLTKYVFLQEKGKLLAFDNRRVLFSFTFFMFFYNIFIGILSCLLRIIKSVVIGIVFVSRLDNSALPRRFQMLDPGFANYCGFIHVECAHTHPVMITFLRLLMIDTEKSKSDGLEMHNIVIDRKDSDNQKKHSRSSKARARARWFLLYTLYNNPTIRVYRKSYLDYVKVIQERLARQYKLNKATVGSLVKNVNNVLMSNDKADIDDVSVETNEDITTNQANWSALLSMNKFLLQIQKDVNRKISAKKGQESVEKNNTETVNEHRDGETKDDQRNPDSADCATDTSKYKQFDTDTDVNSKSTRSLWKRAASLSLENKAAIHPTSSA